VPGSSATACGCPESHLWGRRLTAWFRPHRDGLSRRLHACRLSAASAFAPRGIPLVYSSIPNDRLDFVIPYDRSGWPGFHVPDLIARLRNGICLVLDADGFETEDGHETHAALWKQGK